MSLKMIRWIILNVFEFFAWKCALIYANEDVQFEFPFSRV